MVHDGPNWRMKTRRAALILSAAFLPLLAFAASRGSCAEHHAHAQSQCRRADAFHQSNDDAADQSRASRRGRTWAPIAWRGRRRRARHHEFDPTGRRGSACSRRFPMRGFRPTSIRPARMRFAVPTANASIVRSCRPAAATAARPGRPMARAMADRASNAQAAVNTARSPERTRRRNRRRAIHRRGR